MGTLGGLREVKDFPNSIETLDLGRFAVDEHNKQQNGDISFRRVVGAQQQVVAGTMYHLTIEAEDDDHPKLYKAKVWVKPWENFKRLAEFKPVEQSSVSRADLGVKQGNLQPLELLDQTENSSSGFHMENAQVLTGILSDLAEIGGSMKTGISRLSSNNALHGISIEEKSSALKEEECLKSAVGITDKDLTFEMNMSMHPETWLAFDDLDGNLNVVEEDEQSTSDESHYGETGSPHSQESGKKLSTAAPPFNPRATLPVFGTIAVTPFKDGIASDPGGILPRPIIISHFNNTMAAVTPIRKSPHQSPATRVPYGPRLSGYNRASPRDPRSKAQYIPNGEQTTEGNSLNVPCGCMNRMNPNAAEFIPGKSWLSSQSTSPPVISPRQTSSLDDDTEAQFNGRKGL